MRDAVHHTSRGAPRPHPTEASVMMNASSTPTPTGWVFDSSTGYYQNPSSGVWFDSQRGLYYANNRWLSTAEYTAMYATSTTAPAHVAHPAMQTRGGGSTSGNNAVGVGGAQGADGGLRRRAAQPTGRSALAEAAARARRCKYLRF